MNRSIHSRLRSALLTVALVAPMAAFVPTVASLGASTKPDPGQPRSAERAVAAADAVATLGLGRLTARKGESLSRAGVVAGSGDLTYVRYARSYRGLPVVGGDAIVTADQSGAVLDTTVPTTKSAAVPSIRPTVASATADRLARARVTKLRAFSRSRLVVYMPGAVRPKLAWASRVEGTKKGAPSVQDVYVDARTGKLLASVERIISATATGNGSHNGRVTFTTTGTGPYTMKSTAAPGLQCSESGTPYSDADNIWGTGAGTDRVTGCVDVMYAGEQLSGMLRQWAGRNGIDGKGGNFPAEVGMNDPNAYWDGTKAVFGRNQANTKLVTSMDVVAHEFGHGVFQFSGGDVGGPIADGMNESTGDIIGNATEFFANNPNDPGDGDVGEKVDLVGQGPIRFMNDPSRVRGNPNCVISHTWFTEVHDGAGPQNHFFYLLAFGNKPTNGLPSSPICGGGPSSVTGIGVDKAFNIFINGLQQKTSSWNYRPARVAMLNAAKNLYPGSCTEFNAVKDAWAGAGQGPVWGEPSCTPAPADYSLTVSPAAGSVVAGGAVSTTLTTTTTSGAAQPVTLAAAGLPSGANVAFSPATVTTGGTATMTVTTAATTPAGSYPLTVTASGTPTRTTSYTLTVTPRPSPSPTPTVSPSATGSPTPTVTSSPTVSASPTVTPTTTSSPTPTVAPNPTPPNVDVAKVMAHLQQFQGFATAAGGNRRAGTPGFESSVAYVESQLRNAGYTVTRQRCTTCSNPSDNLIAEWPGGDVNNTIMFGAHLDSVSAGPGINDNGSGSAALLGAALAIAERRPATTAKLRFAWWTDEEAGLLGSEYYAANLSAAEKSQIKAYYNFDMVASRNGGYFINNLTSPQAAYLKAYFDSIGVQTEENVEGQGRSDDASFQDNAIPSSGFASGASNWKSIGQAIKWGGNWWQPYDSCYHRSCDVYPTNLNTTILDRASDAIAYVAWKRAVAP